MTKAEYMNSLHKHLHRLPQEDKQKALDYFEEYFAEAGKDNEAKAIEDLGAPESAADQIITNLAIANAKEPVKNMKKGLHSAWIGVLAVFAAPIAFPLTLGVTIVVFSLLLVFFY